MFSKDTLFRELALRILGEKDLLAPNTKDAARVKLSRLIVYFGDMRLSEITETDWARYMEARKRARPGCKFFDDRKYMRQVMRRAFFEGISQRLIRLRIPDIPSEIGREIRPEEIKRLFENADGELQFQMEIAYKMGLRLREMLRLQWSRFDLDAKVIRLLPADTKTKRGRVVPINPDLLSRFQARACTARSPYVFPHPQSPLKPVNTNRRAWEKCRAAANVRARWHDWRHTCISIAMRKRARRTTIKKTIGTTDQTIDRYDHLDSADYEEFAKSMSEKK